MKSSAAVSRVKVSADGHGVVSHAGVGMLREVADLTGLSSQVTAALADTYNGPWIHAPGRGVRRSGRRGGRWRGLCRRGRSVVGRSRARVRRGGLDDHAVAAGR